jgi:hypothetical protein
MRSLINRLDNIIEKHEKELFIALVSFIAGISVVNFWIAILY